ncbi:MAG: D-aminoacyl-tRNA deacylase [bacterium]
MIGLLQRVTGARVEIDGDTVGEIGQGLMVLLGVEKGDTHKQADRLLQRLLGYRVFADENDRMNLSVQDVDGGLLLVPQFTLAADTRTGRRPSFTSAAPPDHGRAMFEYFLQQAKEAHTTVEAGRFGADMLVSLSNDGPVTFWLQVAPEGQ